MAEEPSNQTQGESPPMPDAPPGAAEKSPRAFAQGVGLVLQVIGGILFFSSCCVCSSAWLVNPSLEPDQVAALLDRNPSALDDGQSPLRQPGRVGVAVTVLASTTGGLALAAVGLGLQSEKRGAGWGAVIATGLLSAALGAAGVGIWVGGGSIAVGIWNAVMLLLMFVLLGFSIAALRQMLRFPPPKDLHVLPPDWEPPVSRH